VIAWPESLRGRVVLVVLMATFIALTVATAALALYDARSYRQAVTADLSTQAEILARTNAPALAFDDPQAAHENLALMHDRPAILAAGLYKSTGDLFASYSRDSSAEASVPAMPGATGVYIEGDQIWVVKRVMENREQVGTVLLRARYELGERLANYLVILVAVMLASLCVALLVSSFLQARVTNPILSFTDVVRQVMKRRDFSLRVAQTDTRELDVLVDAFNEMLAEVGRQTEALAETNRSLQKETVERRGAENALRIADRHKDEFLATLAHELRNPLAPLFNGMALLKMPPRAGIEPDKILDMMQRQIRQMVRLIDDLLDVSRIATNKLVLRKSVMDLAGAVNSAVETVGPFIHERGHTLDVRLPADPVLMEGDATRLAQVFANLLHNAAKFTAPGGRIVVAVTHDARGVTVTVADNGIGIAASMLTRVFGLFEQADQSLERAQAGLGVGLSLARRIVELHGGMLEAKSEGPGHGSEFVVRLADVPLPERMTETIAVSPATSGTSGHRILIVDDNNDFAASLSAILEGLGNEVRVANDGEAGLKEAQRFIPDIAFLDIGMPKINGYDLATRLRKLPVLAHSMLVAVTGWGQGKDRQQAQTAGFDHHLVKPVEPDKVVALLSLAPRDTHG
jgi:signal transduction histidine kinase/ActR/RegA family two-component response regulator